MDTTAEGILGIDVEMAAPGDQMKIAGAHLDGVPEDARKRLRESNASIQDLTPSGSGMAVRVIQEGVSVGLLGSQANARVRVPLESTPAKRNAPTPVLTGSEGMFIIDRVRQRHGNREFGTYGNGSGYDYAQVPTGAQIIWALEIAGLKMGQLPEMKG